MKTILLGLTIALMNFSAAQCSAQVSKLPKEMPENVEMSFHQNAGMIYAFTNLVIANQAMTVEEKVGSEKQARKWSAKIERSEQENLYKLFVENKFDTLKNDPRKGIVNDAGSQGISLNLGTGASFSISYGPNSPLSGEHKTRYQTIVNALSALRARYEGKAQNSGDSNIAVLSLSGESFKLRFKNSIPAELSDKEISNVKDILKKAVDEYNSKLNKDNRIDNLDRYKFQLVAATNANGDKEVWVNAFCSDFEKDWRTEIIGVEDGGRCYFNFYVNLTKQTFDRFSVNGDA
jgi:hypothetical protein